jgi:hypothetical protein
VAEGLRRLAGLICALALVACGDDAPPPPDMKDPASIARAFVTAYNAKDLQRMLPLHDKVNIEAIAEALDGGPGSEAYERVFVPDMVELLSEQAGAVEGPRYDGRDAVMKVAANELGDVYTIVLEKGDDDEWIIVAHSQMGAQQFQALPDQPKR